MRKADQFRDPIEARIMQTGSYFGASPLRQDLRVAIRIACDFHDFLQECDDQTDRAKCENMAGRIRAGIEEFYSLSYEGNCVRGLQLKSGFGSKPPVSQFELKSFYCSTFDELVRCQSPAEGIGLLVQLTRTMLFFMATYFPYPVSSNSKAHTLLDPERSLDQRTLPD
jgi:hypothetical protein